MAERSGETVAGSTANFLVQKGITTLFGVPGGENIPLLEAFRKAGLRFVLMHHEASAGYAADVTGQLTDRPGICLSTVGPGAINLLAGATGATLERSPMLAITAEIDPGVRSRITHMKIDQPGLFRLGLKGSYSLAADDVSYSLEQAWRLACSPPRGGVHLSVAPGVSQLPASPEAKQVAPIPESLSPDPDALAAAGERLKRARRVFLLAGLGVEASQAGGPLLELAEAWQTPVAVTPKTKGQFPEDHPLFAGCYSAYGDRELRRALAESDLILGVGLDGVDFVTSVWDIPTPLVDLNAGLADDPVTRPVVAVEGDLIQALRAVIPLRTAGQNGPRLAEDIRQSLARDLDTGHSPSEDR